MIHSCVAFVCVFFFLFGKYAHVTRARHGERQLKRIKKKERKKDRKTEKKRKEQMFTDLAHVTLLELAAGVHVLHGLLSGASGDAVAILAAPAEPLNKQRKC